MSDSNHPRAKYRHLLDDKNVRRWYENIARGSSSCAEIYLRNIGNFCAAMNTSPSALAQKSTKEIEDILMDYIGLTEKKHAGSYIRNTIKIAKSWLAHNEIQLKRKIRITAANETPTLKDERVPTKEELKHIFLASSTQARAACAIVAHAGLRLESLGNYHASDGLRISDLPELKIEGTKATFERTPTSVVVRSSLSKTRLQYFTFLTDEACGYLKNYFEERLRDGEILAPDSPVITPKFAKKPFIRTVNIGDLMRLGIRNAGIKSRPYVLRCYFDTMLMLAESKGLVLRDYRQFWMGHKGDIENRYTTNKQRLPDSIIEDMRQAYGRSQEFLQTIEKPSTSKEVLAQSFREQLLLVAGFSKDEIEKMDASFMGDDKLQEIVRKKLLGAPANSGVKQKAVHINEVAKYLSQGWEFVANLPDKQVVIRNNTQQ